MNDMELELMLKDSILQKIDGIDDVKILFKARIALDGETDKFAESASAPVHAFPNYGGGHSASGSRVAARTRSLNPFSYGKKGIAVFLAIVIFVVGSVAGLTTWLFLRNGGSIIDPGLMTREKALEKMTNQVVKAKDSYNDMYDASRKNGGLYASGTASTSSTLFAENDADADKQVGMDDIVEIIAGKLTQPNRIDPSSSNIIKSYISDIFTYSQIQLSLLNAHGYAALTHEYELSYDKINWDGVSTSPIDKNWFRSVLPFSASFPGVDLDTGRVYCKQQHVSSGTRADAQLEYVYNSESDMTVTTLNWHYNNDGSFKVFEYHMCDVKSKLVLYGWGTTAGDKINFTGRTAYHLSATLSGFNASEVEKMNYFMNIEIARITGKIAELEEENEHLAELSEEEFEKPTSSHSVEMDFDLLRKMMGGI